MALGSSVLGWLVAFKTSRRSCVVDIHLPGGPIGCTKTLDQFKTLYQMICMAGDMPQKGVHIWDNGIDYTSLWGRPEWFKKEESKYKRRCSKAVTETT